LHCWLQLSTSGSGKPQAAEFSLKRISRGRQKRYSISNWKHLHYNYCFVYFNYQAIFLVIVDVGEDLAALTCAIITCAAQFLLASLLCLTGLSSSQTYLLILHILALKCLILFAQLKGMIQYVSLWHVYVLGYGFPLIVTLLTLSDTMIRDTFTTAYFREDSCWLDARYMFTLKVLLACVLFFNTYIIIYTWLTGCEVCKKIVNVLISSLHLQAMKWLRWQLLLANVVIFPWFFDYYSTFGQNWQWVFIIWNFLAGLGVFWETFKVTSTISSNTLEKELETTTHGAVEVSSTTDVVVIDGGSTNYPITSQQIAQEVVKENVDSQSVGFQGGGA